MPRHTKRALRARVRLLASCAVGCCSRRFARRASLGTLCDRCCAVIILARARVVCHARDVARVAPAFFDRVMLRAFLWLLAVFEICHTIFASALLELFERRCTVPRVHSLRFAAASENCTHAFPFRCAEVLAQRIVRDCVSHSHVLALYGSDNAFDRRLVQHSPRRHRE